ncbi:TadE/TadG family type IV pilus assembly protein [Streptomyces mauvecolor]|uniref:TadE/TadG family type IV pilus assembly protein n=1 Tax=Streptomyces mauvecolor TaxID=58345 RepID=A0ABV9UL12_9ACTN
MASRNRSRADDRGAASTELVLAVPLLLVLLLLIVQFALAEHAQHIAQAAASRALATARAQDSTSQAGDARAAATLRLLGSRVLLNPAVQVSRGGEHVVVDVHGEVVALVPGLHLRVAGHAAGPVERWSQGVPG